MDNYEEDDELEEFIALLEDTGVDESLRERSIKNKNVIVNQSRSKN